MTRPKETLAEKLARQQIKYNELNKQARHEGRVFLSTATREQSDLLVSLLDAKDALEKTKAEVDGQAARIAELKAKVRIKKLGLDERIKLAEEGKDQDLDVLVNDNHPWVRMAVLKHGRSQDLAVLVHDKVNYVRKAANKKINEGGKEIEDTLDQG